MNAALLACGSHVYPSVEKADLRRRAVLSQRGRLVFGHSAAELVG